MGDWLQAALLALVQGLTEFLPISSAAHLILVPLLLGWPDQGLAFDVAVHAGTLAAVLAYFRRELRAMVRDWWAHVAGGPPTAQARLAWAVLAATVPTGVAGLLLWDTVAGQLRTPQVIAATTIGYALLLAWADLGGRRRRDEYTLGWRDVVVIGCAQALALVPGTSRSGVTMTAALALGLTRVAAARFSFLLAIPTIALAGALGVVEFARSESAADWQNAAFGALAAAVAAYACIRFFLALIERVGMMPFVVYRVALGAWLLYVF